MTYDISKGIERQFVTTILTLAGTGVDATPRVFRE